MKRIIRLTESDLARIVKRVINESVSSKEIENHFKNKGYRLTNQNLVKTCGNLTSELKIIKNNDGSVSKIMETQKVKNKNGEVMTSYADHDVSKKTTEYAISVTEESIKYGFEKYSDSITGCKSII
jgi:hypothetical protein